ncbi:MAG TPA: hypothetical protein VML55_07645 [Planctomycetaceae bacterium]|nr:hypothetical protein [Planctomycetaceae bacterium]
MTPRPAISFAPAHQVPLVFLGLLGVLQMGLPAADPPLDAAAAHDAAIEFCRSVDAYPVRDQNRDVVSINFGGTELDYVTPRLTLKELPELAGQLRAFPKLREVKLYIGPRNDDDLRHLAGLEQLTSVSIFVSEQDQANAFSGAGLGHLRGLPRLQTLRFTQVRRGDAVLLYASELPTLRNLAVDASHVTDAGLEPLQALQLESFSAYNNELTGAGLVHLRHMRELRSLDLRGNHIADAGLKHLATGVNLQSLDLCRNQITAGGLVHLAGLTGLGELRLAGNKISGAGLRHLAGLAELRQLNVERNVQVDDAGLAALAELPELESVGLRHTRVGIDALRRFRQQRPEVRLDFLGQFAYGLDDRWRVGLDDEWRVRSMTLYEPGDDSDLAVFARPEFAGVEGISLPAPQRITGKGLIHLRALKSLKRLSLDECLIGEEGLAHIGRMSQLESLEIDEGGITDRDLRHIRGLVRLKRLSLINNGLSDRALVHLRNMSQLESLNLARNPIDGRGLARLLCAGTLRELMLAGTILTDEALPQIGRMENLETLLLDDARITDAGLAHLTSLKNIHSLQLGGTRVTTAGGQWLQARLPADTVIWPGRTWPPR